MTESIDWQLWGNNPTVYQKSETKGIAPGEIVYSLSSPNAKESDFGVLGYETDVTAFRGKRLALKAKIKAEDTHTGASLWMRADRPEPNHEEPAFDNMWNRCVVGTYDWQEYRIVLNIPTDATKLVYGGLLRGAGKAWFKDFLLEVVDESIPLTQMKFAAKPAQSQ